LGEKIDKIITDTLQRLNIPTRKDMEEIKARLERLEKAAEKKEYPVKGKQDCREGLPSLRPNILRPDYGFHCHL